VVGISTSATQSAIMKSLVNPLFRTVLVPALILLTVSSLRANSGDDREDAVKSSSVSLVSTATAAHTKTAALKSEMRMVKANATLLYAEMDLVDSGLSHAAFQSAFIGYYKLKKKGLLRKTHILTICDFSQSSSQERMYVIDVRNRRVLYRTYVAHGINSGEEFASSFSNKMESCKSSLGFYITGGVYTGVNGLSLRIDGVDKGFNDNARKRSIVIHGANYVSVRVLHKYGVMGTTFGCPAIPSEMTTQIIPVVKHGSCFYIYYPSRKYLAESRVLNS
jgi:L,D-transpeptidase catalytic domain